MIETVSVGSVLKSRGYDFYSGVPCSFLKDLINYAMNDCEYVMAANEGDAVAICAGAQIAGRKTVVLMQNSGLGNAVSPLTSLNAIFRVPVLGFVSLRGDPGLADEPQHELMGVITGDLLSAMKIEWAYLSQDLAEAAEQVEAADAFVAVGKTFFFVVKKDTFSKVALKPERRPTESADLPARPVVVLDGDGSALMRTGAFAVNAAYKPARFLHVLLDNTAHESTGGQATVSAGVDWTALARAAGYPTALEVRDPGELAAAVSSWSAKGGTVFIHARIRQGVREKLGRPKARPFEVATRLSAFLKKDSGPW
jgi:sulfopyruvate decarboxylase TPP-binding subunit